MSSNNYENVHQLASKLMEAAESQDQSSFDLLYKELEAICIEHENTQNDHPVQWETLGDFTENLEQAIVVYTKALDKAQARKSKEYLASIAYSMASLQLELGNKQQAITNLELAKKSAAKLDDRQLKREINQLLEQAES